MSIDSFADCVVFVGPTLSGLDASSILDATYRPPASQGDVYLAARGRPWGIAIIDGFFEREPAVWHKEILWAMSEGIHLLGSSSMGALRAAELEQLGMIGVGSVFEAFRSGRLEDDDEVTVVHGEASSGYRCLSEAMVNIRATLGAALEAGVITDGAHSLLIKHAKQLFYPQRSYRAMVDLARSDGGSPDELEALLAWLPGGRIDVKRDDALELLDHLRQLRQEHPGPMRARFTFQHTDAWEQVRRQIDRRAPGSAPGKGARNVHGEITKSTILDELRARGSAYLEARRRALARAAMVELSLIEAPHVSPEQAAEALQVLRRQHQLLEPEQLASWMVAQGLDGARLGNLVQDQARAGRLETMLAAELERHLPELLQLEGCWAELEARARSKQSLLQANGLESPSLADTGLDEDGLWQWYFVEHLGIEIPDDIEAHAKSFDHGSVDALCRSALREWCYLDLEGRAESG